MKPKTSTTAREGYLEERLKVLLDALDRQHLDGKPPGAYSYSMRVKQAMVEGRAALSPARRRVSHLDLAVTKAA